MIRLDHVEKRYRGGIQALREISISIDRGDMIVLTGPSGAGKSTLLTLVAGIESPSSGRIELNGADLARLGRRSMPYVRRQFGLVFQDHKLLFDRDAFDNVALPLRIAGMDGRSIGRRVQAALERVGLADRARAMPIALSGGEQQRLCIARAIVHRPAIVLADEPTGNLDLAYATAIVDLLQTLNTAGVTVIIATHDRMIAQRVRARSVRLEDGILTEVQI